MLRTAVRVVLVIAACATGGSLLSGQQRPVFRSDAHFVLVDAYPIRDGKVVEGLTAADFAVREDGVPQTIDTFEFVAGSSAEPESSRRDPNTITESREMAADPRARAFVVDLDIHHVSIAGSHRIRVPLVRMLNEMLAPGDLFGVMSTEHDPGTLTFAKKITTAEDMLARYWSWGMRDSAVLHEEEQGITNCFATEVLPSGDIVDRFIEDGARVRKLPDLIIELYRESKVLDHLDDLVDVLGHMREGRTSVVLVTEGWRLFPPNSKLVAEIERTQRNGPPGPGSVAGRIQMFDSINQGVRDTCILMGQRLARTDHRQRLRDLIARANERNVSFIPVNPAGLVVTETPIGEKIIPVADPTKSVLIDDFDRITIREDGLRTLADRTDGLAVVKNNDLHAGLRKVTDRLKSFYLLGYYSTNRTFDGGTRHIVVTAASKDIEVKARRGYRAPTEAERAARANPVAAVGPSPIELALDVLSGIRSADDRTFNVSRYLKADAAPILGVPAVSRATPSPRSPLVAVTAPAFTRRERIHIEWPVALGLVERSARILGRNGKPLAVQVTLTEREASGVTTLVADAVLGALAPGDYVVEVTVAAAAGIKTALVAFRVVP
ncbi:MAG: VWA domain-containing protein [Acidobacteria bacterium]|nr:VWA domain-containing protein [Acidobacteriota bacterium]